jgi:hypothetical protein
VHPKANAARIAKRTASRFSVGNVPGMPMQVGQQWVFGSPPKAAVHPQNILVWVASST